MRPDHTIHPFEAHPGDTTDWITNLTDDHCKEIFWLYVENPDEFLNAHPPALLGQAMRYALRTVVADTERQNKE